MASSTIPMIGLILCSQRKPRVCPQIADYVFNILNNDSSQTGQKAARVKIRKIDLATWNLPMMDEPLNPSKITHFSQYLHQHTQNWSQEISKYSGFVLVTPQYNRGYPASIKNALDYLAHEWKGKPAMVVSYGGRGAGRKAAIQLKDVLLSLGMVPIETMPGLPIPSVSSDAMAKGSRGEDIGLSEHRDVWKEEEKEILKSFDDLVYLLSGRTSVVL
jgi:NAD(P)H-dependent FMN reductase